MGTKRESQAGHFELCSENKGFSYDGELSNENIVTGHDKPSCNPIKSDTNLNYDKILDHIGQFGRYFRLPIL